MFSDIIIVGKGDYARVVRGLIADDLLAYYNYLGCIGPGDEPINSIMNPCLGVDKDIARFGSDINVVIAVGDPAIRKQVYEKLNKYNGKICWPLITHKDTSFNMSNVDLGKGIVIQQYFSATVGVKIGDFVIINPHVSIGHDVNVGNFTTIHHGATISGRVNIGDGVTIGQGACILPRVSIGCNAIVGAGAVVTKDVEEDDVVVGVPARTTLPFGD